MSNNIPTWYVSQFSTNIQLLLQQKGSRLSGAVMNGTHVGKQASPVDQIGAVAAQKVIGRYNPMARVDASLDRRWVFPVDYDLPQLIDSFDKLRILTDPSSQYVVNATYALGRAKDDEVLAAATGTAKTGVDGSVSTVFLAANVVSVQQGAASPTALTVAKLRQAKKLLMQNEVDIENDPIYMPINAYAHDSLLAEAQIIDMDYNDKPVLVEGKISRFLGINFIHSERLLTGTDDQAGSSTLVPCWAKSGMYMGMWDDIKSDISQRKDLQGLPYQAYCYGTFGATRLEEKKVVKVYVR
jgi:hypothetical protein